MGNIREALSYYLNAPSTEDFHNQVSQYDDISIKQWEANIYHLKAQLSLSKTILHAKNATIEALQLSNYQYKQLINSQNELGNKK